MTGELYRCFDASGRLLYVGSTRNWRARAVSHEAHTWWYRDVAAVKVTVYPTLAEARTAERAAIASENPRWNTQGRWAVRDRWSEDDWRDYAHARRRSNTSAVREHLERVAAEFRVRFGHDLEAPVSA